MNLQSAPNPAFLTMSLLRARNRPHLAIVDVRVFDRPQTCLRGRTCGPTGIYAQGTGSSVTWTPCPGARSRRSLVRIAGYYPLALLLAVLVVAGCGKKGPPIPPGVHTPPPVEGLRVEVRGYEVRISWRVPAEITVGSGPNDLEHYLLFRENVLERESSDCECRQWEPLDTVDPEYPSNAFIDEERVEYILPLAGYERSRIYAFTVATKTQYGMVSPMAPDRIVNLAPPPRPVQGLEATEGEQQVDLSWQPSEGADLYRVYRFGEGEERPDQPLATAAESHFVDREVEMGRTYSYLVTALGEGRGLGSYAPESRPSSTVSATPHDLTPPPSPEGLIAIPTEVEVRLSWTATIAEDLAGYRVWRGIDDSDTAPVARLSVARTTFTDTDVAVAGTYRYRVTAVDRAGNESEPSQEVRVDRESGP